jgi:hypothetical protein
VSEQSGLSAAEFGTAFKGFLEQAAQGGGTAEPVFAQRIRAHFEADPTQLPIVSQQFETADHANVQVAVDAVTGREGCAVELLGVGGTMRGMMSAALSDLITPPNVGMMGGEGPRIGPVEYTTITLDERTLSCVLLGLYLVSDGEQRFALLVRGPMQQVFAQEITVEVMAATRSAAEGFLADLRTVMRERNIYRGHVLALSVKPPDNRLTVEFQRLPEVARDGVILPESTLVRVERHTLGIARHRERLLAAGRHLKRGLLLYGPPGTGKTLTTMYLIGEMRDRTTLLLTGRAQGLIPRACALARSLQPSLVVLEDVDLVATERTEDANCGPLLFELLNEMDGLAEDVDVIFLLTTNRADLLEPALAARPGRIDQAVLVPLPDADCRRRLFELYGRGLSLQLDDLDAAIARTEGVSAAFIKELLRRAALVAADADATTVADDHLSEALREMLVEGDTLTRRLLGATHATEPPPVADTNG